MPVFDRRISRTLVTSLNALADQKTPNWWQEVLRQPDLFIAIRGGYLNAYAAGQSVFKVGAETGKDTNGAGHPVVMLHYKYLLKPARPRGQEYVAFDGTQFLQGGRPLDPTTIIQTGYRAGQTVRDLTKAALAYSDAEKQAVHVIARNNPNVIDLEIAIRAEDEQTGDKTASRIDLAALTEGENSTARIVFYEVKRASDKRLRAKSGPPLVVAQMAGYRSFLRANKTTLARAYTEVCKVQVDLLGGPNGRQFHPLIGDVAVGKRSLAIDPEPRLLITEFNADQRDGVYLRDHLVRLRKEFELTVLAKGNPKSFDLSRA